MRKIKIMHVVYVFELGGIETFIQQLCNKIDHERYESYLVVMTNERLAQVHLLDQKVKIINFNNRQGEVKSIYGFYKTLKELIRTIEKIEPDVVHTHHEHYVSFFIQLACKLSKARLVNIRTVHSGGDFYINQNSLLDKIKLCIEKLSVRFFDINMVAVSAAVYSNNLRYFGNLAKDNTVIYNGVDLCKFDKSLYKDVKRKQFGFEDSSVLFAYVSRLNTGKNHEFLIKIWRKVIQQVPSAVLVFAGDGPLFEQLRKLSYACEVSKNIVFLGSIDNVPELLSVVDVGVFPSKFEGMSIAFLEKLAMKLPVVASDIEAFRDIANDGIDSFLISTDSEDIFVNKLIDLAMSKDLRDQVGEEAYISANQYSLEKTLDKYEKYYKSKVLEANS